MLHTRTSLITYLGIIKHNVGKDKVITTQKVIEMNSFARYELRMQTIDVKEEKKKNSYFLYFWQEKLICNTRSTIYKIWVFQKRLLIPRHLFFTDDAKILWSQENWLKFNFSSQNFSRVRIFFQIRFKSYLL